MRAMAPAISRRRLLAAAAVAIPAMGLARMISNQGVDAANVKVDIVNFAFTPNPLTISQYDTVTWTNQDTTPHTVTSDTPGQFNSGPLQKGQSVQVTFNKAGTFTYHCSIHPNMHGTVVVNQVFAAIAVVPGAPAAQPPPDFQQVPPPAPETVTTTAPPAPAPPAPPPVPQAPPVQQAPPSNVPSAPPPNVVPPAPPRTGGGGEADFVRRLGDG